MENNIRILFSPYVKIVVQYNGQIKLLIIQWDLLETGRGRNIANHSVGLVVEDLKENKGSNLRIMLQKLMVLR